MNNVAKVEQTTGQGESLEQVEQRFARWRESRTPGQCIPPDLWAAAAGVARQHGVHRTSCVLRLDYNGLKRRFVYQISLKPSPSKGFDIFRFSNVAIRFVFNI
jgi:hypothetical protein